MEPEVILVDEADAVLGSCGKLHAHEQGFLHRAFSVFLFNGAGHWLLHQRAADKYHSPGSWTNACCSHPAPGSTTEAAAHERLGYEMGMVCPLRHAFAFTYRAEVGKGLVEHEYDHVFIGTTDLEPRPDPREVQAWRWVDTASLREELDRTPEHFTPWFRIAWQRVLEHIANGNGSL